jgi:hypothetical protein
VKAKHGLYDDGAPLPSNLLSVVKVKLSDEKTVSLESDLPNANNKVHNLRHEHQFTSQEKANLEGQLKQ